MSIALNTKVQIQAATGVRNERHLGLVGKVHATEEGKGGETIYVVNVVTGKAGRPPVGRYTEDQLVILETPAEDEAAEPEVEQETLPIA